MLGRNSYTTEELAAGQAAVKQQLAAYKKIAKAAGTDKALGELEPVFFNNMVLVLDRYYVHRIRATSGKDTNPLTEVELIVESLLSNDGVMRTNNVIKYVPGKSVLKLEAGAKIRLTQGDFERLSKAFFAELESKFL